MTQEFNIPYKILRLRSGQDVIARIVGRKGDKLIIERPMQMKLASVFNGMDQKEVLLFRNWLQFTDADETKIPFDWVASFLTPQREIADLYDIEKRKEDEIQKQLEELEKAEPEDKLSILHKTLENIRNIKRGDDEEPEEKRDNLKFKDLIEPGSIIVNLAIPPYVFFQIISEGLLENFDLEHIMDTIIEKEQEDWEPPKDINNPNFGNRIDDWSPNLEDYLE